MNQGNKLNPFLIEDGIIYKKLGEVCQFNRGSSITKKEITPGNIPVIGGGVKPSFYHNTSNRIGETIAVSGDGANAGFVSFWTSPVFLSGSTISVKPDEKLLLPRFVYYHLKNLQEKIYNLKQGAGVPHVYGKSLAKLLIPIPPLGIQQKIVNILDTFTEQEAELVAELVAELEARKKQYRCCRDKLLTFDENTDGGG